VSRLSSDRLTIGLWPHGVSIRSGVFTHERVEWDEWRPRSADDADVTGKGAVPVITEWFTDTPHRRIDADIVVSNSFARLQILEWSEELNGLREWYTVARAQMEMTWGMVPGDDWELRLDRRRFHMGRLACAFNKHFLNSLRELERLPGFQIRSIQANLARSFNLFAETIGSGIAIVVVPEKENITIGAVNRGSWVHMRTIPVAPLQDSSELRTLIERERLLLGLPDDASMFVCERADRGPEETSLASWSTAPRTS
jgi:hypothetical protein